MFAMKILLSNDDGINAPGLHALYKGLLAIGDVTVVAPESEQSAVGHAITIADPLRVREVAGDGKDGKIFGYAVNGTPADCVKIGIKALLKKNPDILVSGINQGGNVATNIIYSGTVSAATEGTLLGVPSVALSLNTFVKPDFTAAVEVSIDIIKKTAEKSLPKGTLLNVNIPPLKKDEIKGIRVCRQSDRVFQVSFDKRSDLRGIDYYWQGGEMDFSEPDENADIHALEKGYVTITPIQYDLTNHSFLDDLKTWDWCRVGTDD